MLKITPFGTPKEITPGVGRVTFSTKTRRITPGIIRAQVELGGLFNTTGVKPRIVAQADDGSWMTWEGENPDRT